MGLGPPKYFTSVQLRRILEDLVIFKHLQSVLLFGLFAFGVTPASYGQSEANFPTPAEKAGGFGVLAPSESDQNPARLISPHPSGTIGLTHTISAQTQPSGLDSVGFFLHGNYFVKKDFPKTPSGNLISERFDSNFGFVYTPLPYLELFLATGVLISNNEPPANPQIKQTLNFNGGFKVVYPVVEKVSVGLMYQLDQRNAVLSIPGSSFALNHRLIAASTVQPFEFLRVHGNLGLEINNNERVTANETDPRFLSILKVQEKNPLIFALGAEYLWKFLSASLEYSIDYSLGGEGGLSKQPQRASFSTRLFPFKDRALSGYLGLDVSLASQDAGAGVTEPPLLYNFGLAYLLGVKKHPAKENTGAKFPKDTPESQPKRINSTPASASNRGRITGYVTNIETGDPVPGAKLFFCTQPDQPVVADSDGRYRSPSLDVESCEIRVEHPEYKTTSETVDVDRSSERSFDFGMLRQAMEKGDLLIRVKDIEGNPTPATISFPGLTEMEAVRTNEYGQAKIPVNPGRIKVVANAKGFEIQSQEVQISSKQSLFVDFALEKEPDSASEPEEQNSQLSDPVPGAEPLSEGGEPSGPGITDSNFNPQAKISKDGKKILVSHRIVFEAANAKLTEPSKVILKTVAEFLESNPKITKVLIAGHTDASGNATKNTQLSKERADAVKSYLISEGVQASRLQSKGFGSSKPIASNDTDEGKAKNRRVEFIIQF